jgi:excisionase family DNA binding protein
MMLLTARTVAERLSVSLSEVYRLTSAGRLPCHRIGHGNKRAAIRYSEDDLATFLAGCREVGKVAVNGKAKLNRDGFRCLRAFGFKR